MNADTQRYVEAIRKCRWYPAHQTLGADGWPAVYAFASGWKRYRLVSPGGEEGQVITAEDDAAAWAAYDTIYARRGAVIEEITTTRIVPEPEQSAS